MGRKKIKAEKRKINLVFDPEARREFLTGFRKRKIERQKKAQDQFKAQLKEEKRKIKQEAKESYKKLVVSHQSVPEVEHLLKEEHDMGTHTVEIVELSTHELAKQNNWIGSNQMKYESEEKEEEEEDSNQESDTELVPGMDVNAKPRKKEVPSTKPLTVPKTGKDIKRAIKKQATKHVKKSKIFQTKNRIEKIKNRKKSAQMKRQRKNIQSHSKKGRRQRKPEPA